MIPQALGFFGWKRPEIAKKTLAALARCRGIERWPVIAYLDHRYDPETRRAIQQWKASELIADCASQERLGCSGNLTRGIMDLFETCSGRFIVLEDDCYPAEDFIEYMESELGCWEHVGSDCEYAISASAYRPIGDRKIPWVHYLDSKMTPGFHCWGWGTWKSRMGHFHNALIPVRGDAHADSWDVRLNQYAADHGMGCIIPRLCRVLNIGTQDATHTNGEDLRKDEWTGSEDPKEIRK